MTSAAMVHVHDPRVRWSVPASQVVRIIAASDWLASAPIDVLAMLGPVPDPDDHARRVVVVRGAHDRETALVAGGPVRIEELEATDLLALPDVFSLAMPQIAAIAVSHDASMSLVLRPSAVAGTDAAPLSEEPCPSRS
jgi:chemotaxis signal transduction protein